MGADEPDLVRLYRLKLLRLLSITRRTLVMAKVLLNAVPSMSESKKEEVGKWLQLHEQDVDKQEEEELEKQRKEEKKEVAPVVDEATRQPEPAPTATPTLPLPAPESKPAESSAAKAESFVRASSDMPKSPRSATVMGHNRMMRSASSSATSGAEPARHQHSAAARPVSEDAAGKTASLGRATGPETLRLVKASGAKQPAVPPVSLPKRPAAAAAAGAASGGTLAANDAATLQAFPNKSFAVMLERAAFLPANALVEVVCRSEQVWFVKVRGGGCVRVFPFLV